MQGPSIPATGTLTAIAAAVTPVVMISANAILIGAISSKHQAMSDRVRDLTAEWRNAGTSEARRESIRTQIQHFMMRIAWISRAHFLLYAATACFMAMVLVIALAPVITSLPALELMSLPLLLGGVILMLTAIVFELLDLSKARATIEMESREVS